MSKATTNIIKAAKRSADQNPRQLRAAGLIPATVYGKNTPSFSIQIPEHDFTMAYVAGEREFKLEGLDKPLSAKAHQVQINPVRRKILNIEFLVA